MATRLLGVGMRGFLVLAGLSSCAVCHAWVLADGDFNPGNWVFDYDSSRGTASAELRDTNGNPGANVWIRLIVDGNQSEPLQASYYRPDFTYDPSSQGAVTTLYFAQDGYGGGGYIDTEAHFMVMQNGVKYFSQPFFGYPGRGQLPAWVTLTGATHSWDFTSLSGQHPDWTSNGSTLTFGVMRALDPNIVSNDYQNGLDNFLVGTTPVPEPASLVGLAAGFCWLRRRNKRTAVRTQVGRVLGSCMAAD